MSWKTDRLVALLPELYAARQPESLLYRILDAAGRELLAADGSVKGLLKSHWVDYAQGQALDGLAATFGIRRRVVLGDGPEGAERPESDDAFRQRLRSFVQLSTGGGTKKAILGAVRSALGLPFDLDDLPLPQGMEKLREDLGRLVTLTEFTPDETEVVAFAADATTEQDHTRLDLDIELTTARPESPRVEVEVTLGVARDLSVELAGDEPAGVAARLELGVRAGETLVLENDRARGFTARVVGGPGGLRSVSHLFTALDRVRAPLLPQVPTGPSTWIVRSGSGFADGAAAAASAFDEDAFDLPLFNVRMVWVRYQPLTFDVQVPYRLDEDVQALVRQYGYGGRVFVYAGLPRSRLQEVVDQTRAAGVRGRVGFSLSLADVHQTGEGLRGSLALRQVEDAEPGEALTAGSLNALTEVHDQQESLRIGGVFDVSSYDDEHQGFL